MSELFLPKEIWKIIIDQDSNFIFTKESRTIQDRLKDSEPTYDYFINLNQMMTNLSLDFSQIHQEDKFSVRCWYNSRRIQCN